MDRSVLKQAMEAPLNLKSVVASYRLQITEYQFLPNQLAKKNTLSFLVAFSNSDLSGAQY
jgi:hypothetical protein